MSVTPMIGCLVRLVGSRYGRGSGSVQGQDIGHRISSALYLLLSPSTSTVTTRRSSTFQPSHDLSQQSVSPSVTTLMRYPEFGLGIDSFVTFFFWQHNIIVSSKQQQQQQEEKFLRVSRGGSSR